MIAVLVAIGAAVALVIVLVVRKARARTRRRFDAILLRIDDQLGSISDSLREAVARAEEVGGSSIAEPGSVVDLDAAIDVASHRFETNDVQSARGYDAELEREIVSARATQRPLALVLIRLRQRAGAPEIETAATEVAAALGRVARTSDIVVRKGTDEFGVLLPETTEEGAQLFHVRLRAELATSVDSKTLSTGVVEWRPPETSASFDARARSAAGLGVVEPLGRSRATFEIPEAR